MRVWQLLPFGLALLPEQGYVKPQNLPQNQATVSQCMNPESQPELLINDNCPNSLTNRSQCMESSAWKKNCVAYCEQLLYWFFGPPIPWPNSHCGYNETCIFQSGNTFAVTNSYTIVSGVTETLKLAGLDELSLAFNQGATYTFSKTASTQQTVSKTRPELDNSTGYCGYWTFLPYFVSSCGFFLGGQRKAGDWANGYYLQDEPYYTCSDDPKVTFARTNTTYLDSNGNAEGVTVFVQTYCAENLESEDTGIEDSRYNDVPPPGVVVQPVAAIDIPYTKEIVPDSYQTCYRACLCGYELEGDKRQKFTAPQLQLNPYADCKCFDALPAIFFHLLNPMDKLSRGEDIQYEVPVTPTNVSLLESSQYTNISFGEETPYADFFNLTYPPYPAINLTWVSIDESDSRIIRKPFECFAEYDQSQDIFVDYLNYLANDQHEQGENPPWIPTPTASS